MNAELQYEINRFYYHEAYLLDNRKFEEWLDLLTNDIVYRMPMRVTCENKDGSNISENSLYFEETKKSLTTRVKRLRTTSAWAEDPAPRTRHLVTNIIIENGSADDSLSVRNSFLFLRSRAGDAGIEQLCGERLDVLRKVNNQWQIASRKIIPDQAVLGVMNLSMFL
ncbi:aromatic-ring-hydroxylating dioxygenase subunit beta [Brevibacillus massiliensis]|uniref:aromatic-ring-hydroxylating dioxygenase subunit beta n=1 Tax=Brevibacillus massiliensis TaxID=1118054 RepID=UPI00031B9BCD|nr:3-phenylpropionate/cinnamic acid dioxygenase subunit beta [Brevibacillus massiliensis]